MTSGFFTLSRNLSMRPLAKHLVFVVALLGIALIASGCAAARSGVASPADGARSDLPYTDL